AAAAAITGDNIGYWIGDKGGYRLAHRYGPAVRLDESKLKIARHLFDTYGGTVGVFGPFVARLRTYTAFLAGVSKITTSLLRGVRVLPRPLSFLVQPPRGGDDGVRARTDVLTGGRPAGDADPHGRPVLPYGRAAPACPVVLNGPHQGQGLVIGSR